MYAGKQEERTNDELQKRIPKQPKHRMQEKSRYHKVSDPGCPSEVYFIRSCRTHMLQAGFGGKLKIAATGKALNRPDPQTQQSAGFIHGSHSDHNFEGTRYVDKGRTYWYDKRREMEREAHKEREKDGQSRIAGSKSCEADPLCLEWSSLPHKKIKTSMQRIPK